MSHPELRRIDIGTTAPDEDVVASMTSVEHALLLTISEAAQALNVGENWLRKKVSARAVPFTRLGRHVRFTPAHLERIIADGDQPPLPAPPAGGHGVSRRARRAS